jgi:hypothetical protein
MATKLLEQNKLNRPLSQAHVNRLANQIQRGLWRLNGETIKVAATGDVLDGQHRLWAVIETNTAIETYIVYGIDREAFCTIDTLRRPRSGGDIVALEGAERYRTVIACALTWLIRYQRKCLENYRDPTHRVENADIQGSYHDNPGIKRSSEVAMTLSGLATPSVFAFLHFIISTRNPEIAERMIATLSNPSGIRLEDPFFRLRSWLLQAKGAKRDALMMIALTIKAANAAAKGKTIGTLRWQNQGAHPEEFPVLDL